MATKPINQYGLKSQVLMPTSSKLMTQYLVVNHLNNHYKKVNTAQSRIDNSAPKSWSSSQKVRDQTQREALHTMSLHSKNLASTSRDLDMKTKNEDMDFSRRSSTSPDYKLRRSNEYYGGMGTKQSNYYTSDDHYNYTNNHLSRSENYENSFHSDSYNKEGYKRQSSAPPASSDILDKFGHRFTSGGEFQPRVLQRQATSKLSGTKFYNPPKRTSSKQNDTDQKKSDTLENENTMLLNETLMSHDEREKRMPKDIPGLNITCDEDNLKWLQQRQLRQKQQQRTLLWKSSMGQSNKMESINETTPREYEPRTAVKMTNRKALFTDHESNDEEVYVKFMVEVTSDILDHGIVTKSVLQRIFNRHLDRVRGTVHNEARLYDALNDICSQIGISQDMHDFTAGDNFSSRITDVTDASKSYANVMQNSNSGNMFMSTSMDNELNKFSVNSSHDIAPSYEHFGVTNGTQDFDSSRKNDAEESTHKLDNDSSSHENDNSNFVENSSAGASSALKIHRSISIVSDTSNIEQLQAYESTLERSEDFTA